MTALNNKLHIEPMRLTDLAAVLAIERASFPNPWPARAFRYELRTNERSHFFVARLRNAPRDWRWVRRKQPVVGYVGYWLVLDEAHISTIAVHPNFRRRGIGERLLRAMLTDARSRGAGEATLEVRATNEQAQTLYRKYGFEHVGRRKGYYRDNTEDALLMTLRPIRLDAITTRSDAVASTGVAGQ